MLHASTLGLTTNLRVHCMHKHILPDIADRIHSPVLLRILGLHNVFNHSLVTPSTYACIHTQIIDNYYKTSMAR